VREARGMTRATVVGAGGLGGPLALALGAAGIQLTIVDPDLVEDSNLHRQIHFEPADVGKPKASVLASSIVARGGIARGFQTKWTAEDAEDISGDCQMIVDGSDDPLTKFAVADWAVASGRPHVIAAAIRYGGNVLVGAPGSACYRCLFEDPPFDAGTCSEVGILGPVVGAIGGVAAALAIGVARGNYDHAGSIFVFEDLRTSSEPRIVRFAPRVGCPACAHAKVPPGEHLKVG
jgi:molybdopterin/thiamine biosynthesis adenylyltransferase